MYSWIINRESRVRDTGVSPQDGVWVTPAWMAKTITTVDLKKDEIMEGILEDTGRGWWDLSSSNR